MKERLRPATPQSTIPSASLGVCAPERWSQVQTTGKHQFSVRVLDIAAVARAVIDDDFLHIDRSRVVIAGFSAGTKLALTSSQLPELQGRIRAVVSTSPSPTGAHRQT